MRRNYDEVVARLNEMTPLSAVKEREGGGRKLSYLEGWYVINRLNEVLGVTNWAYTAEANLVHAGEITDKYGKPVQTVHYIAKVTLIATVGEHTTQFTDYGYGDGTDKQNIGKAHELAVKEAVTDGIKRCAKNLGMSLGLCLYDKTQEFVGDEPKEAEVKPRTGTGNTKRVAAVKPASVGSADSKPSPAPAASAILTKEPADKAEALLMVSPLAEVAVAKKKATVDDLKAYVQGTFGVNSSAELTLEQLKELIQYLRNLITS